MPLSVPSPFPSLVLLPCAEERPKWMLKAEKPERRAGKPQRSARFPQASVLRTLQKERKDSKGKTDVGKDSGNPEHSRNAKTSQA